MIEKKTKKLSLDAFKAKSELEKVDINNLGGALLAACHDGTSVPKPKEPKTSSTCLFPSNYNSCRCC
ncbi:MAG: hypothetical protein MK105_05330 [Crocinitomicaceae bacterium]|nr:hypothetical protein [Crocinitomicaceae bacterium]